MIRLKRTGRGFKIGVFADRYGSQCSIQKSSLATESAIWLGVDDPNPRIMASSAEKLGVSTKETTGWIDYPISDQVSLTTRMHLTQKQAADLIPLLQSFVDTGELKIEMDVNDTPNN
jgi:hypothetical protein